MKPAPLPPEAAKEAVPRGATVTDVGVIPSAAETATVAEAVLPRESWTTTVSTVGPAEPATYAPVVGSRNAPDPLLPNAKT